MGQVSLYFDKHCGPNITKKKDYKYEI
jgi:hypothetical protein